MSQSATSTAAMAVIVDGAAPPIGARWKNWPGVLDAAGVTAMRFGTR